MTSRTAASTYHATDGAAYDIFLGRWTQRLAEPFLDFIGPPSEGALLDVGCGTGSLARAMAARWPRRAVVGVDIAAPYVAFARSRSQGNNPAFGVAGAARLPFADGAFSGAVAQLVLNFVPDPVAALNEMKRVTAPGGRLAATVWDFRGGLVYQRMFWDSAAGLDPAAGLVRDRLFAGALALPDGLLRLFEQAGLERIERALLTIRMDYANFDDYWQPLLTGQGPVGTYAAALAPSLRSQIESLVRAAFLSGAADGPRSLTATAWAVRGRVG
jgi:SAM-dependent methyltransferase